ncbi:MAG: hypothetical protein HHJ11_07590 [Phycicoccus sp.]|nr:hypothetical protein [Phycicoccus sp.]NMM34453.1 hypothetical protein [Phycicoccus sp.]
MTAPSNVPSTAPSNAPTVAGRLGDATVSVRRAMSGTPGRLRILALSTVAVSLIFALSAFSTFGSTHDALGRGEANTAQLVRIQAIHTNLIRADADATNAFLVGGLEPAAQRTEYTSSLAQAARLIAEAAKAQPADGPALGALNNSLLTYAGLIEQARATNRQALPVGAQYLRIASSSLRSDALPILDALVKANEARVSAELDRAAGASSPLIASGVLALLVLLGGMGWLSLRTHRLVNPPLAAATAIILVTLVVGSISLAAVGSRVDDVRKGSYAATLATAKARIAAFDAKSNESLTLIARGSGSAFQKAWVSSSEVVTAQSAVAGRLNDRAAKLDQLWVSYAKTHALIRKADDEGRWESAVALATGSGAGAAGVTSANVSFDAFDTSSAAALTSSSRAASDSLNTPLTWLPFVSWLGLLVGLAAAVSAWWGVSLRLEEYR